MGVHLCPCFPYANDQALFHDHQVVGVVGGEDQIMNSLGGGGGLCVYDKQLGMILPHLRRTQWFRPAFLRVKDNNGRVGIATACRK